MTPADPEALRRLLADTDALLLDFDGPVCSVFAGLPASVVVDQLCVVLADGGYGDPPPDIEKSADPFDVLKYAATLGEDEARFINAAFTAHEVEAVATSEPTPGAEDFIRAWFETGRLLAIVSNNSALAVDTYVDAHDLRRFVSHISGRTIPNPTLLKPNPHLLNLALLTLKVSPRKAIMIGDSSTDIEAAHSSGTRSIGYANKPGKLLTLAGAHPDHIISQMGTLIELLI